MANFLQILRGVSAAMQVAEAIADRGKGKQKQDVVIDIVGIAIPQLTNHLTTDEMKKPAIEAALRQYMDATIALQKAIKQETGKEVSFS